MATTNTPKDAGFPPLSWDEPDPVTRPMPLHELPRQVAVEKAFAVIDKHHERLGKAIRQFWGTRDCVEYIEKLVMNGGDGFGNARVGFKSEVLAALLSLITLHKQGE